ncbi:MAG: tripartite tricarboxylate transporter substrate binding protein [Burkholderiales bacterium]
MMHKLAAYVALLILSITAVNANAQGYPTKPIRLVVPYPAGGATDLVARLATASMADALGQPIVVENRAGAAGVTAMEAVAKAPSDGYTLIAVFDNFSNNPQLFKNVAYDPVRDFAPIALLVRSPQVLLVHPKSNLKTLDDFVKLAKIKGNALNYASAGAGSSGHLTVELFKLTVGIDLTPIHYKGGGPAINDMLGGQVDLMFTPAGFAAPHVKSGKLIGLAVTSTRRTDQLPDVPAIAESYPGFEAQAWIGLLAPAGTPQAIVARLNAEVVKSLARPDVMGKLAGQGYELVGGTPEAFGNWIQAESAKWGRVIRERTITLD